MPPRLMANDAGVAALPIAGARAARASSLAGCSAARTGKKSAGRVSSATVKNSSPTKGPRNSSDTTTANTAIEVPKGPNVDISDIDPLAPRYKEWEERAKSFQSTETVKAPTLPFGGDRLGRHVLAKVLKGAEVSIMVGVLAAVVAGLFSSCAAGRVDRVEDRVDRREDRVGTLGPYAVYEGPTTNADGNFAQFAHRAIYGVDPDGELEGVFRNRCRAGCRCHAAGRPLQCHR